jgi:hypothetical protein
MLSIFKLQNGFKEFNFLIYNCYQTMPPRKYTTRKEKTIENWLFNPEYYTEETSFLPRSVQVQLKHQIQDSSLDPIENVAELNPIIAKKLEAACISYKKKQDRSRSTAMKLRQAKVAAQEEEGSGVGAQEPHDELHELISDMKLKYA